MADNDNPPDAAEMIATAQLRVGIEALLRDKLASFLDVNTPAARHLVNEIADDIVGTAVDMRVKINEARAAAALLAGQLNDAATAFAKLDDMLASTLKLLMFISQGLASGNVLAKSVRLPRNMADTYRQLGVDPDRAELRAVIDVLTTAIYGVLKGGSTH